MKYFIHTTGCKANQWDSYAVSSKLRDAGFVSGPLKDADLIIINACTLTGGAERDIRRFINRSRRENEKAKVVLTGCHGQVYPERAFGADLVLGQSEKFRIPDFLDKEGVFVSERGLFSLETSPVSTPLKGKTRFFLKIQDGCDNFCAYCVVPYARGNPKSRPLNEILETMKTLKEKGVKEVVLTGIEVSAYRDPVTGIDFKGLLEALGGHETPPRIRLSSIDPLSMDDELIRITAETEKIMKSFHISLQSASDEILQGMCRKYTQAFIRELLEKIRRAIPRVGIGFDVIAGFPGEDWDRFAETMRFLEWADIYYLHVFPFSARIGTKAACMGGKVSEGEKKERVRLLREIDRAKREAFYRRFIGEGGLIIPEGKLYRGMYMRGYTDNYIPVYIPYEKNLENKLVQVKIMGIDNGLVMGRPETYRPCSACGPND